MANLYTFGCSFTYGHGLQDCHKENNNPGDEPSKLAWPQKLGKKIGYVTHNNGKCGADNLTILSQIMETHTLFTADDTVVILWSFNSRYSFFQKDQMRYVTTQVTPYGVSAWSRRKGGYMVSPGNKRYNQYHAHFSSAFNDRIRTLLVANTAYHYLKDKVKTVIQVSLEPVVTDYFTKELCQAPLKGVWSDYVTSQGKALDGIHPDEEAHEEFANSLHSIWKNKSESVFNVTELFNEH